jgi:hypothetical protein
MVLPPSTVPDPTLAENAKQAIIVLIDTPMFS